MKPTVLVVTFSKSSEPYSPCCELLRRSVMTPAPQDTWQSPEHVSLLVAIQHCTLYTVHSCTLYTVHCTLYTAVHCTLYTVHYSVQQCTVYRLHRIAAISPLLRHIPDPSFPRSIPPFPIGRPNLTWRTTMLVAKVTVSWRGQTIFAFYPNCLFTRLESLASSQKDFWWLNFCRNCIFKKPFVLVCSDCMFELMFSKPNLQLAFIVNPQKFSLVLGSSL